MLGIENAFDAALVCKDSGRPGGCRSGVDARDPKAAPMLKQDPALVSHLALFKREHDSPGEVQSCNADLIVSPSVSRCRAR
jgi:hypothetical protein